MQVILIEDVKSLGKKGTIVKVNDSYARNYIIPRKLGIEANKANLNDLKLQKAAEAKHEAEVLAAAKELATKIDGHSGDRRKDSSYCHPYRKGRKGLRIRDQQGSGGSDQQGTEGRYR